MYVGMYACMHVCIFMHVCTYVAFANGLQDQQHAR
jgi:hypothetical protein